MAIEIFFIALISLYLVTHLYLLFGLNKSLNLKKNYNTDLPFVSVIVAARNESDNIQRCISSLSKINYPVHLLEIILVNDNSTDDTYELMLRSTKDIESFKVINSSGKKPNKLKGKVNALDTAISQSKGTVIISTDADCAVHPEWVKQTVSYYSSDTAMVCGFTSIKNDGSLFSKMQCLDWMYLLTLASSSAGLKKILSCMGNNLSFSKKAYTEIGGYESIKFSVTEDLALMRELDRKNYEIKFPADPECLAETLPCKSLKELFSQKRRWFRGGIGINPLGYLIGFELFTANLLLVTGIFILDIGLFFALIIVKSLSEIILLSGVLKRFRLTGLYKFYPLFTFYFAFYGLTLPVSFLFNTRIKWKGQKY